MRILCLISTLQRGGAERVLSCIASELAKGHEVTCMTTHRGHDAFTLHPKVRRMDMSIPWLQSWSRTQTVIICLRVTLHCIFSSYDACLSFLPGPNIIAAFLGYVHLIKRTVLSERTAPSYPGFGRFYHRILGFFSPSIDVFAVQTEGSRSYYETLLPHSTIAVIPNPVQYPVRSHGSLALPEDIIKSSEKLLLAVGRLVPDKRFDMLLRAFAHHKKRSWRLCIIGEGPLRRTLKHYAHQLRIEDRVHFPGVVRFLHRWYKRADLMALTSSVEGFPNVLLEAMSYGVCCLSINCPTGPADLLSGDCGVLCEDENDFIKKLGCLMEDEGARARYGQKAHFKAHNHYKISDVMRLWMNALGLCKRSGM